MRYFIGIPIPQEAKSPLINAQKLFSKVEARMNLVSPKNIHITLLFLGEVNNIEKIITELREVKFQKFKVSFKDISYFKHNGYIRVIYSPIIKGKEKLKNLYDNIVKVLQITNNKFTPHVTLARVKFVKSTNTLSRVCNDIKFEKSFTINLFNIYSSKLTPKGPTYDIIESFKAVDFLKKDTNNL